MKCISYLDIDVVSSGLVSEHTNESFKEFDELSRASFFEHLVDIGKLLLVDRLNVMSRSIGLGVGIGL